MVRCFTLLTALLVSSFVSSLEAIKIQTSYGAVQGKISYNGRVREFTSIPYAAAPIGDLRWKNPTTHAGWHNETLNATIEPWGCPQECADPGTPGVCPPETKEDCLILSIFTPNTNNQNKKTDGNTSGNDSNNLPVMVYIHGGGWMENYGGGIRLNATNVVNFTQNVIIVLINYRLGALGMYYDESLNIYGNFMYLDQRFAIEWVYNEISNFGGNPNNIMIFGESAGGDSMLLYLIDQAIINGSIPNRVKTMIGESSVPGEASQTPQTWKESNISSNVIDLLGCDNNDNDKDKTLECLKNVPYEKIVEIQNNVTANAVRGWEATVKTQLFADQALLSIQNGIYNHNISTIFGSNKHESHLFFSSKTNQTNKEFLQFWNQILGVDITNEMIKYYNLTNLIENCDNCNFINYTMVINTDTMFRCPSRNITSELSKNNKNDNGVTHRHYHLNYISNELNKQWFSQNPDCWNHVCHTNELWYLFDDDLQQLPNHNYTWNENEITLRNQFMLYWTNFAVDNDPNRGNSKQNQILTVNWTQFDPNDKNTLSFDVGNKMQMVMDPDANPCDFWDSTNYQWLENL